MFVSERGALLSAPGFSRMVERAGLTAKLGIKVHALMLRHACGFALTNQGHAIPAPRKPISATPISKTQRATRPWRSLDSRAKCNRALREPDLHVFAKVFEDCLKRSLEAKAFSGREIGGDDDVLDFLVGHFVDVDLTRQPAS